MLVTYADPFNQVSSIVYVVSAVALLSLAVVTLFTDFKGKFLPFKICSCTGVIGCANHAGGCSIEREPGHCG